MSWGWRYSGPGIVYCASISAAVTWWIGTRERPCGIRGGPRTGAVGSAISCGAKALRICLAFGDWRPLHREAILVAKLRNIRVWAFEEGYLRPHYITMEEGGVNGNSMLPHSPALLRELAESHPAPPSPVAVQNPLSARVWKAIAYYAGTIFLRPFFPWFPDASPAERRERSLGMVPSRPDPPHMGKAFGGRASGKSTGRVRPISCFRSSLIRIPKSAVIRRSAG